MPYTYKDEVATADVAFEATGKTREELFKACCDATVNVMVDDLREIAPERKFNITVREESLEMLLYKLLSELIYYKDAEGLLLRVAGVKICDNSRLLADAEVEGEPIDPRRHRLRTDVKAVTFHLFSLEHTPSAWRAFVVLDI